MKESLNYKIGRLMLPGLKRWILIIFLGIATIVLGVLLLLGYHPITASGTFIREMMENAADALPHRISGLIVIICGGIVICLSIARITMSILGAYLPEDRESIADVLYRKRHLDHGPKVVVVGGGTGLSNLLRGLKNFTNNITAIVTVADDGGSSGILRQELGVLPPGDIRNCIAALADEDKLVTDLFQYRFQSGESLQGHSFGNLFLTALCSLTGGDFLKAVRTASLVLNSCGQVLPSSLSSVSLIAEMENGELVRGESNISTTNTKIKRILCEPTNPKATPEAISAIMKADLVVLGPGSLYTSIIPNLLVQEIVNAIKQTKAKRIYVCNVLTQKGETTNYNAFDHVQALLEYANCPVDASYKFIDAVLVNNKQPNLSPNYPARVVDYSHDQLQSLGIQVEAKPLLSNEIIGHHDAIALARALLFWYSQQKRHKKDQKQVGVNIHAN